MHIYFKEPHSKKNIDYTKTQYFIARSKSLSMCATTTNTSKHHILQSPHI